MIRGECITFQGYIGAKGYGFGRLDGKPQNAHRWAYEKAKGPIPAGLVIDHLCRNRACINPDHLEAVTQQVNVLRGMGPGLLGKRRASLTHCAQGHEFTPANTYHDGRQRYCRICKAEIQRAYRARMKGKP